MSWNPFQDPHYFYIVNKMDVSNSMPHLNKQTPTFEWRMVEVYLRTDIKVTYVGTRLDYLLKLYKSFLTP
jgi:hypothetical protein